MDPPSTSPPLARDLTVVAAATRLPTSPVAIAAPEWVPHFCLEEEDLVPIIQRAARRPDSTLPRPPEFAFQPPRNDLDRELART